LFQQLQEFALKPPHFLYRHGVQHAACRHVKYQHLLFHRQRHVLILLQDLRKPLAARELSLRHLVELIGAKTARKPQARGTVAMSSRSEPATCRMALICALPPTRLTEIPTLMAGRIPALKRSASR